MVRALLARSTNPDPPRELTYTALGKFIGTNFAYRLVNEFSIEAADSKENSPTMLPVPISSESRHRSEMQNLFSKTM